MEKELEQKIKALKEFIKDKTDLGTANYVGGEIRKICGLVEAIRYTERMYSQEEVKYFLDRYRSQFRMDKNIDVKQSDFTQWFEKFKKK